jgi:glycine dehydrogenase subunit 1
MISDITGMEITNASMYDGATALAEAMLMATRIKGKDKILVSETINPNYRQVLDTYAKFSGIQLVKIPHKDGLTDIETIRQNMDDAAAVLVQSPNFFGCIEPLQDIRNCGDFLLVSSTTEVLSWAMLRPFGELGVDILTAEGQSFGNQMNFGGPGLGVFSTKKEYMRQVPGRLVGKTLDLEGNRGFILTLCTREQHIRRERATSNICSNEGLCALSAAIYLSTVGTNLKALAELNHKLEVYLRQQLATIGIETVFNNPFFNEFVVRTKKRPKGVEFGIDLCGYYPDNHELKDCRLLCCTEMNTKKDIDDTIEKLR